MSKTIIILTGSELRHDFFRRFLGRSEGIRILASYREGLEKSLRAIVEKETADASLRTMHLEAREQCERDFFCSFVESVPDLSNPVSLPKGEINSPAHVQAIIDAKPDLLVAFGCSLIKEPLLGAFSGRFLNVHLGLSPYYRGSATNFWPLVNGEPEYVGATFMHIDAGVDTGEIIHQIRPKFARGDTPSQVGNRLIGQMCRAYRDVILDLGRLRRMPQPPKPAVERVCKKKDYTEDSVRKLYDNFRNGLIERYLAEQEARCAKVPIVVNPDLRTDSGA